MSKENQKRGRRPALRTGPVNTDTSDEKEEVSRRRQAVRNALKQELAREVAAARREGIDPTTQVDRRKKSRNKQIIERAERAATVAPPVDATLDILGTGALVTEMAKAGVGKEGRDVASAGVDVGLTDEMIGIGGTSPSSGEGSSESGDELEFDDPFGVTGGL